MILKLKTYLKHDFPEISFTVFIKDHFLLSVSHLELNVTRSSKRKCIINVLFNNWNGNSVKEWGGNFKLKRVASFFLMENVYCVYCVFNSNAIRVPEHKNRHVKKTAIHWLMVQNVRQPNVAEGSINPLNDSYSFNMQTRCLYMIIRRLMRLVVFVYFVISF